MRSASRLREGREEAGSGQARRAGARAGAAGARHAPNALGRPSGGAGRGQRVELDLQSHADHGRDLVERPAARQPLERPEVLQEGLLGPHLPQHAGDLGEEEGGAAVALGGVGGRGRGGGGGVGDGKVGLGGAESGRRHVVGDEAGDDGEHLGLRLGRETLRREGRVGDAPKLGAHPPLSTTAPPATASSHLQYRRVEGDAVEEEMEERAELLAPPVGILRGTTRVAITPQNAPVCIHQDQTKLLSA